jgi:hypothetical protein
MKSGSGLVSRSSFCGIGAAPPPTPHQREDDGGDHQRYEAALENFHRVCRDEGSPEGFAQNGGNEKRWPDCLFKAAFFRVVAVDELSVDMR